MNAIEIVKLMIDNNISLEDVIQAFTDFQAYNIHCKKNPQKFM